MSGTSTSTTSHFSSKSSLKHHTYIFTYFICSKLLILAINWNLDYVNKAYKNSGMLELETCTLWYFEFEASRRCAVCTQSQAHPRIRSPIVMITWLRGHDKDRRELTSLICSSGTWTILVLMRHSLSGFSSHFSSLRKLRWLEHSVVVTWKDENSERKYKRKQQNKEQRTMERWEKVRERKKLTGEHCSSGTGAHCSFVSTLHSCLVRISFLRVVMLTKVKVKTGFPTLSCRLPWSHLCTPRSQLDCTSALSHSRTCKIM